MSARSRKPDTESFGIESRSVLASSRLQTGVLPFLTTYFGPRTECAGFDRVTCRTTRKSYNIRTAASFSLMVGLDPGKSSIQAATLRLGSIRYLLMFDLQQFRCVMNSAVAVVVVANRTIEKVVPQDTVECFSAG